MQGETLARYKRHPSSLLWLDHLCEAGKDLRERCCEMQTYDPDVMQRLGKEARDLLARGDPSSCAAVLVCLADRCRDASDLVQAREYCEAATSLFSGYDDCRHAHNLAVAHYTLGLVYQSLALEAEVTGRDGSALEADAISSYDSALQAFQEARLQWMRVRDCGPRRMNECDEVKRWIKELRQGLASGRQAPPLPTSTLVEIPIWSTSAGNLLRAREEPEGWAQVEESVLGLAEFALRVKGNSMVDAGINDGDLALIQETAEWPGDGQIVVVRIDGMESESVLKRFYRRQDHVCLEPANVRYPFLVFLPGWRLKEEIKKRYGQSHADRRLEFFLESSVHCIGRYRGKCRPTADGHFQCEGAKQGA